MQYNEFFNFYNTNTLYNRKFLDKQGSKVMEDILSDSDHRINLKKFFRKNK